MGLLLPLGFIVFLIGKIKGFTGQAMLVIATKK